MKYKTTAKAIRQESKYIPTLSIGYCGACNLLRFHEPVAYTCGVYGWNFDIYAIDGVHICTGYRGMVGKTPNNDILRLYEDAATKVMGMNELSWEEKEQKVEKLLSAFIHDACVFG